MRRYGAALTLALAAWLATLLLGAMLLTATRAAAAVGDLEFQGCLAQPPGPPECDPVASLAFPTPLAISPDGTSLYTAGLITEHLTHLTRADDGALAFGSCITTPAVAIGCATVPDLPVRRSHSILVSPDGTAVYVSSGLQSAVSRFTRDPVSGRPTFGECLTSGFQTFACTFLDFGPAVLGLPLGGAWGLEASPDGGSVYAAGSLFDTVSELSPAQPTGELGFSGCLGEDDLHTCAELPDEPFSEPLNIAVAPDGSSFHVLSRGGSIASFRRSVPIGGSQYFGCLGEAAAVGNCGRVPDQSLHGAFDVAISPDGTSLYAVADDGGVLTHFSRTATGRLAFEACFSSEPVEDCIDLPGSPLSGAIGVAIAPDGASVYVAASDADAVAAFARRSNGSLAYRDCFAEATAAGGHCAEIPAGTLDQPFGLVVSPDGSSVYVTGASSHSVVAFTRVPGPPEDPDDPGPGEPGPEGPGEGPAPDEPDPKDPQSPQRPHTPGRHDPRPPVEPARASCGAKPATIVGTPRADTLRGTPRRDVIAALGGADEIRGRGGNDLICGGGGKDTILGGGGKDRCLGGPGRNDVGCERGRTR